MLQEVDYVASALSSRPAHAAIRFENFVSESLLPAAFPERAQLQWTVWQTLGYPRSPTGWTQSLSGSLRGRVPDLD